MTARSEPSTDSNATQLSETMPGFPLSPKHHPHSSLSRSSSEETRGSSAPPRAQISRSSRLSAPSRQEPRDINGIPQLQPGGMERRGSTNNFDTYESSVRSYLDGSGRISDSPVALAALLGPGVYHGRSSLTGWVLPPPLEANSPEPPASDPRVSSSRTTIDHDRDRPPTPRDDGDSVARPSDEGALQPDEAQQPDQAPCPRCHLRARLLRTLDSVLDILNEPDPDDEPNPSAWQQ
jgi:hypothetical protein